jgi:hypothetical protein
MCAQEQLGGTLPISGRALAGLVQRHSLAGKTRKAMYRGLGDAHGTSNTMDFAKPRPARSNETHIQPLTENEREGFVVRVDAVSEGAVAVTVPVRQGAAPET